MLSNSVVFRRPRLRFTAVAFSRHSALSSVRVLHAPARNLGTIIASLLIGCAFIGIAVNMMVVAGLGLSPYDVFSSGISHRTGLSLGQAGWAIAAVLFGAASLLGQRPSAWGIIYVLANGVAIDLTSGLINAPASLGGRAAMVAAAIVVMAFGINFVLHAGVTGGAFELLMNAGAERGVDPVKVRYALDVGILLAGIAIGGSLGIATVFYAATMGLVFAQMQLVLQDHRSGRAARMQTDANDDREVVSASS